MLVVLCLICLLLSSGSATTSSVAQVQLFQDKSCTNGNHTRHLFSSLCYGVSWKGYHQGQVYQLDSAQFSDEQLFVYQDSLCNQPITQWEPALSQNCGSMDGVIDADGVNYTTALASEGNYLLGLTFYLDRNCKEAFYIVPELLCFPLAGTAKVGGVVYTFNALAYSFGQTNLRLSFFSDKGCTDLVYNSTVAMSLDSCWPNIFPGLLLLNEARIWAAAVVTLP